MNSSYWMTLICVIFLRGIPCKEFDKCNVKLDLNICNFSENSTSTGCSNIPVCRKHFNMVHMYHKPYSPQILNDTLHLCCGGCISSSIVHNLTKIADLTPELMSSSHFVFPVLGKVDVNYLYGYRFLPLIETPNIYYITTKENNLMIGLITSCLNMWPLFLVCALMVIISGFLCWLAEMRNNEEEFPRSFASGWFEGIWWSFISITTVGYGDKTPKSACGRFLSIIWIIVGITAFSLITATLTSEIVAANNLPPPTIEHSKVGLIRHHKYEGMMIARQGGLLVGIDPPDLMGGIHQLIEMLDNKVIDGFVLDRYEIMLFYHHFKNDPTYQHDVEYVKQKTILTEISGEKNYAYGFLVKLEEDYQFLADFISSNSDVLNTCSSLYLSKISHNTIFTHEKITLFASNGQMFWPSFVVCAIAIVICATFGGVYELRRNGKLIREVCKKKTTSSQKLVPNSYF